MPTERPKSALGSLRQALFVRECGGLGDGELLGRFLAQRDEAAFAALVRRHGPMVLGVCRRVLGHAQDAEDAFQATFLVLLRSAASIRKRESVGNWLYGVAYRTSLEARAAAARRHATERQVESMPEPTVGPAEVADDFRPILDAELSRLPEKYREAVVLCDLEGRPRREAARQLGIPEGTLSSRLAAGRRRLAGRLAGRGITLSEGALAAGLGARTATAAVPAPLLQATVGSALAFTAGAPAAGALPAGVLALTERMMRTMLLIRVKQAVGLLLALAFLGTGAGVVWTGATAREPGWVAQADGPAKGAAERPAGQATESKDVWTLDFRFKDPRHLTVDVPGQGKKTVWYLQYTVANGTEKPHTFIPDFQLSGADPLAKGALHPDLVLPKVEEAIRQVEDPTDHLRIKNSVTVAAEPIPPSRPGGPPQAVNGVAIWDDFPPDTSISIFVGGLSNDWSTTRPATATQPPAAPGMDSEVWRKTLRLNFKRDGDRMVFVPPSQWEYRVALLQRVTGTTGRPQKEDSNKLFPMGFVDRGTVERDDAGKLIDKLDWRLAAMEQERDELRKQIATLREELRRGKEKTAQAPAGQATEKSEDRFEAVQGLQRDLAGLKAKERDRRIYVEFLIRRVRSLRPPAEQDEPGGIEAERRRERFRAMKMALDHKVQEGDEEETDRDLQLDDLTSRLLTLQDLPAVKGEDRAVAEQIEAVLAAADTARKNWKKEREELRKDVEELRRELGERPGGRP